MFDAGQECRVTVELPNGEVFSGKAVAMETRQSMRSDLLMSYGETMEYVPREMEWEMMWRGIGSLASAFKPRPQFAQEVRTSRSAAEWKCDWCGSVNPKSRGKCKSCGGSRSFLYDI